MFVSETSKIILMMYLEPNNKLYEMSKNKMNISHMPQFKK